MIRSARKSDCQDLISLIQELATYEKCPDEVSISALDLEKDGFGANPLFECIVAEEEGKVVGMALYFTKYSTWKGESWHLEDLIVTRDHRGKGWGKALLEELIHRAGKKGVARLDWQVLDWNTPAIDFYKSIGANLDPEWINCRMNNPGI
ncbi:MAG: GNAT family N-acetyltransferase [Flavobacteriales bacterium]|nr:GNAT family N-acetyltransferase [Flavobacteriales bacterium]